MKKNALFALAAAFSVSLASAQAVDWARDPASQGRPLAAAQPGVPTPAAQASAAKPAKLYAYPAPDNGHMPYGRDQFERGLTSVELTFSVEVKPDLNAQHKVTATAKVCDKVQHDPMEAPMPECLYQSFRFYQPLSVDPATGGIMLDGAEIGRVVVGKDRWGDPAYGAKWFPGHEPRYELGPDDDLRVYVPR